MRKTRLIVQPRRCLHTMGFLLLFMSCPTYGDWGLVQPESATTQRAVSLQENGAKTLLKDPPDARITNRPEEMIKPLGTESTRRTNFGHLGRRLEARNLRMSQDFVRVNTPSGMLRQNEPTRRVERGSAERNSRSFKHPIEERYRLETPQRRLLRRESPSDNRRVIEDRRERVLENRRSTYRLPVETRTSSAEEREVRRMNTELVNGRKTSNLAGGPSRRNAKIEGNLSVSRSLVRRKARAPMKEKEIIEPVRKEREQVQSRRLTRKTRELQFERSFIENRNVFDRVNKRGESRGAAKQVNDGASAKAREHEAHRGSIIRERRNERNEEMRITIVENRAERSFPRRSAQNLRRDDTFSRMKRETRRTTEEINNERRKTEILASVGENSRWQKNVRGENRDMRTQSTRQTRRDVREDRNDNTQTRSREIPMARERVERQTRKVKNDKSARTVNRDVERRELSQRRENVQVTGVGELQRSVLIREKRDVRMDQQALERFESRRMQARSQMATAPRKLQDQRKARRERNELRRMEEKKEQRIVDGERRNRFDDRAERSKVQKVRDERELVRSENRRLEGQRNIVRNPDRDQKVDLKKEMLLTTNQVYEKRVTRNQELDENDRKMNFDSVRLMVQYKNDNWSSLKKITGNCVLGAIAFFITTRNPKIAY